jgi:hypothetical protein
MRQELQQLREDVAKLHQEIDAVDDWACSIHNVLELVLPLLLKDHPHGHEVRQSLMRQAKRYRELEQNPHLTEDHVERSALMESAKMLSQHLEPGHLPASPIFARRPRGGI